MLGEGGGGGLREGESKESPPVTLSPFPLPQQFSQRHDFLGITHNTTALLV